MNRFGAEFGLRGRGGNAVQQATFAPDLPLELQRSTPREVELTGNGKAVVVFAVALLVAAVVGGAWLSRIARRDAAAYDTMLGEARAVPAEILSIGRASGDPPRQAVQYRYSVGERTYEQTQRVRRRDAAGWRVGSTITVMYLPSQPAHSWVPGQEKRPLPMPVAILVPCIGVLLAAVFLWQLRRERDFAATGRAAMARVVEVKRMRRGSPHGHHNVTRIQVEFRLLSGALQQGRFDARRGAPVVDALVPILYDAENPQRIVPYPLTLARPVRY